MNTPFKATKITDRVYWVGAIDWELRDFHGYSTNRGSTYNAYLVVDDKVTLVDTVKAPFRDEMLSRVASVVEPANIDFIISNHSEMDHTGSLPEVIRLTNPEKVFASANGVKALASNLHHEYEVTAVGDGQALKLGDLSFQFLETKMLHWPDSMFTYLADEEFLFSQDGFGMHLASTERFADEISETVLLEEGAKYYANIILPYSNFVLKTLARVRELGIPVKHIAPDHGPIWRGAGIPRILELYTKWAGQKPSRKAVVVYDSMWHSTALMAKAIGEGLAAGGASPRLMHLGGCHRSDVLTELLEAGALLVGSPTINGTIFPTVADVLAYIKGLRPKNLIGAAFGSYGWGAAAVKQIRCVLDEINVEPVGEDISVEFVPDGESLNRCVDLGHAVAKKLKSVCPG